MEFENVLVKLVNGQSGNTSYAAEVAKRVTVGISEAFREQGLGFVPNNRRWQVLTELVQKHCRLVLAIMRGIFSPEFLATALGEDLHNRISIMNNQTQVEFNAQLQRGASGPDPSVCSTLIVLTSLS